MPFSERPVDCGCPAALTLKVLDTLPGPIRMVACMKCGRSELADPILTEDTPHDVQLHGFDLCEISEEVRTWASAWPRFIEVDKQWIYLSAAARFESEAELNAAVAAATAEQRGATLRDTLMALGIPSAPPPASLPESLQGFVEIWQGLQLNDETPVEELLDAATRWNGPHQLAAEVLARRMDLSELAAYLLYDPILQKRLWGRYLCREFRLSGPEILAPILAQLRLLNDNMTREMYDVCLLLGNMGAKAVAALPDLQAAAARVEHSDYYMHKDLTDTIKRLQKHQK